MKYTHRLEALLVLAEKPQYKDFEIGFEEF